MLDERGNEGDGGFQVRQSTSITGCVRWSVGRVTHSFDDPHVAPYWPTWPCFLAIQVKDKRTIETSYIPIPNIPFAKKIF